MNGRKRRTGRPRCDDLFSGGGRRNISAVDGAPGRPSRCRSVTNEEIRLEAEPRRRPCRLAVAFAAPAAAQNSAAAPPTVAGTPPKTEPAPPAGTAPPATTPTTTPETAEPPSRWSCQPAPQPAPQQPVTISPDAAYPNGFADPADPFANEARAYNDQQAASTGACSGLLGLLGLIPLIRGNGRARTIYVERDEEPRRVVRRERIDE